MRMLCLDASRRLWSGPSQMNIVHDDHSHVGALTEGGNHDVMVCKGSVPNHRGVTCWSLPTYPAFQNFFVGILSIRKLAMSFPSLTSVRHPVGDVAHDKSTVG